MVSKKPPLITAVDSSPKEELHRPNVPKTIQTSSTNLGFDFHNTPKTHFQTESLNRGQIPQDKTGPFGHNLKPPPTLPNIQPSLTPSPNLKSSLPPIHSSLPRNPSNALTNMANDSKLVSNEFASNGLLVNRYQILQKIGQGGMGQVFSALDLKLKRQIVVKVSYSQGEGPTPEDRARFEREALKMASLNHQNIVTIYDYGQENNDQFLVMELIKGDTLKSLVNHQTSITPWLFKEIISQLLKGVQEAHEHDVIHRDLKPSNLMWDPQRQLLKILDFGLARGVEGDTVTGTGHVHGSIQYMAPEQIRGESQGPATDIYAVGILCFQLLSKSLPFRGENTVELMFQKLQKDPYDLLDQPKTPSWVTQELSDVIRRCLHLKPEHRPKSATNCLEYILKALPAQSQAGEHINVSGNSFDFEDSPQTSIILEEIDFNQTQSPPKSSLRHLLISALLGGLLFQVTFSFFTVQNFKSKKADQASVYFTSIDSLTGIESQVTLSVDGQEKGITPLKLELAPGRHEVILSQDNWSFKKSYELKNGESYWYSLPAPPSIRLDLPTPLSKNEQQNNQATVDLNKSSKRSIAHSPKKSSNSVKKSKRTRYKSRKSRYKKRNSRTNPRKNKVKPVKHRVSKSTRLQKKQNRINANKPKFKPSKPKKSSIDVPLLE